MMTPEQRYLFDVTGYLHLKNALSPEELKAGHEATQRYIDTPPDELPPGFGVDGKRYLHGFAFDKSLEALVFHPKTWQIVMELTNGKPCFTSGTLQVDVAGSSGGRLHCARDDFGWESCRYETRNGQIYCDNFVIFPYFDDVFPGDGGLLVVPGSHKAAFKRLPELFNSGDIKDPSDLPAGVINLTPRAGDILIISELLTHGILPWYPKDRVRRILVLRYKPQHLGRGGSISEEIRARLSPETIELMEYAHFTHIKEIAQKEVVTLN